MKRVRIMLMAICLVAVAGGVLAFKARNPNNYCTNSPVTTTTNGPLVCPTTLNCPNLIETVTTVPVSNFICTTLATVYQGNTTCTFIPAGTTTTSTVKCTDVKATLTTEIP